MYFTPPSYLTGGTGSFGNALIAGLDLDRIKEVRVFSRDELKQDLMRDHFSSQKVKFYIGDVRDRNSVDRAMKGVDFVFHAAALKQVPSCEFFPMEAVMTNVMGSQNVIRSAIAHAIESIVCLSTDKAVMPINAMGMSKALMEKIAVAETRSLGDHRTRLSVVRYGNVMYSRGSVIPLFIQKIKRGHPLTVTNPEMTRFLLSLPEAIQLVFFAFEQVTQGDTFIRKAPAATVLDLAQALKNLFSSQVPIQIIGTRHGEKLFETLATADELLHADDLGDFYRIHSDNRNLNYSQYVSQGTPRLAEFEDYHSHNTQRLSVQEIEQLLLTLPDIQKELETWKPQ